MFPGGIEFKMTNFVRAMSRFHVLSNVVVWPTSDHCNELNLIISLFLHVCAAEIMWNFGVFEHEVIKFIYDQTEGVMSS